MCFVPLIELLDWKSKCPFSDSLTWDHAVWENFPRSGACVAGLVVCHMANHQKQ